VTKHIGYIGRTVRMDDEGMAAFWNLLTSAQQRVGHGAVARRCIICRSDHGTNLSGVRVLTFDEHARTGIERMRVRRRTVCSRKEKLERQGFQITEVS
jgi:hypothetical protein